MTSLEIEARLKDAELSPAGVKEMVARASDEIKSRALTKKLAEAESKKEMTATELSFVANFFGDASKIDGVALSNRVPQMSTPKSAFLLSAESEEGKP